MRVTFIIWIMLAFLFSTSPLLAAKETIGNTSIALNNEIEKNNRLETFVPVWQDQFMQTMFSVYKNPEKYQLQHTKGDHVYDIQFINAFFGPVNNPFNQHPRPAKVFLLYDDNHFYMAPIVKNEADKNYYVFDHKAAHPVLLNDWIAYVQHDNPGMQVRFNICARYGSYPTDTCSSAYQAELNASVGEKTTLETLSLISAKRNIHENWKSKIKQRALTSNQSIINSSVAWADVKKRNDLLSTVNTWNNDQIIDQNFQKLRDFQYFSDPAKTDFLRRISWLFPDDGCWTRASAVMRDLFGPLHFSENKLDERPSKVFAFGNLCANTSNSPTGYVSWWYHTAPIIRNAATHVTYVLDPAINPRHPLRIEEWVAAISDRSKHCSDSKSFVEKISICSGYGSGPHDDCKSSHINETGAVHSQIRFLKYERTRQVDLGRDADAVLGNSPPWINGNA